MASQVFSNVLPLTIDMVGWRLHDACAPCTGSFIVAVHVIDAHQDTMAERVGGRRGVWGIALVGLPLGRNDCAIAKDQLGAVVADAQPLAEAKDAAQPVSGLASHRRRQARE